MKQHPTLDKQVKAVRRRLCPFCARLLQVQQSIAAGEPPRVGLQAARRVLSEHVRLRHDDRRFVLESPVMDRIFRDWGASRPRYEPSHW